MTFKTKYGNYENCSFRASRYSDNGNLALIVESPEEGTIMTVSVNPGLKLGDDVLAVKNYSENEGIDDTLRELGIIHGEPVSVIPSGWVDIPVYKLTEKGRELFKGV